MLNYNDYNFIFCILILTFLYKVYSKKEVFLHFSEPKPHLHEKITFSPLFAKVLKCV